MDNLLTLLAGVVLVVNGSMKLITGEDGIYWGFPVPAWTGWGFVPIGLFFIYLSIRGLRAEIRKKRVKAKESLATAQDEPDK